MRIGNINQSTNFGRIIKIHTTAPNLSKAKEEKAITDLVKVLNNEKSKRYQVPIVHNQIKNYFSAILGDYDGKNTVLTQKYYDEFYLVSGEEAKEISRIKKAVDMDLISSKKAQKKINEIFREKVENGEEDECGIVKPTSVIQIEFTKPDLKADVIKYSSIREQGNEYVKDSLLTYIKRTPTVDIEE